MGEAITPGSGLDRFVHRVDLRPVLDEHGFLRAGSLLDLEANGLRRVSDIAAGPHGFVLLGAGGLGKSTTLEALNAVQPSSHGVINAMLLGRDDLQVVLGCSTGARRAAR